SRHALRVVFVIFDGNPLIREKSLLHGYAPRAVMGIAVSLDTNCTHDLGFPLYCCKILSESPPGLKRSGPHRTAQPQLLFFTERTGVSGMRPLARPPKVSIPVCAHSPLTARRAHKAQLSVQSPSE